MQAQLMPHLPSLKQYWVLIDTSCGLPVIVSTIGIAMAFSV